MRIQGYPGGGDLPRTFIRLDKCSLSVYVGVCIHINLISVTRHAFHT